MIDWYGPTAEPWWQDELDRINGSPGERLSWLKLVWEPGRPWEPVHRWIVYQMVPFRYANRLVQDSLRGENPLKMGKTFSLDGKLVFEDSPDTCVSYRQWLLYQGTKCYGRPYWVVQGSPEGHKYRLNKLESTISRKHGGPKDTPGPGELPFATPDARLFRKLAQGDRIRTYTKMLDFAARKPEQFDAEDREVFEKMEAEVAQFLDYRLTPGANELASALARNRDTRRELGMGLKLSMTH